MWTDGRVWKKAVWLSEVLSASLELAEHAAQQIRSHHDSIKTGEDTRVKGKTDDGVDEPVTQADQSSNAVLVNGYRSRFPQLSIFSEEMAPPDLPPVTRCTCLPHVM